MFAVGILVLACAAAASVPLFAARRNLLLNPAFFVFLVVLWSLPLKALYILVLRQRPTAAALLELLAGGAVLGLAAVVAYACGFLLMGRRTIPAVASASARRFPPPVHGRRRIAILTALCVAAFLAYLGLSGTEFFATPFSTKRFQPAIIGVPSRFHYPPYYFFKLSLLAGSLTYAASLFFLRPDSRREQRDCRLLFAFLFVFSLTLSHFASLRLFILLVVVQIFLLAYHFHERKHLPFLSVFVTLTLISFAAITFVHRARPPVVAEVPPPPATEAPSTPVVEAPSAAAAEAPASEPPPLARRVAYWSSIAFEGRYFMDLSKLAFVARHFPDRHSYLLGASPFGMELPRKSTRVDLNRYLAEVVFEEPGNNVPPGLTGELYINFGWLGVLGGFLTLGLFHRSLHNHLDLPHLPPLLAACLIVVIPSTTLVLLNSGLVPAASRCVLDVATLLVVWPPSSEPGPEPPVS